MGEALSSPLYDPDQGSFGYDRNVGGGMDIVGQAEGFHGLLLENKRKQLYLLKPLGGSTSFLESKFSGKYIIRLILRIHIWMSS